MADAARRSPTQADEFMNLFKMDNPLAVFDAPLQKACVYHLFFALLGKTSISIKELHKALNEEMLYYLKKSKNAIVILC